MPFDPDDPRLTAFALGELDEAERDEFEALLAECPEARQFVADICATSALLRTHFQTEPTPSLLIDQRLAIEQQTQPARNGRARRVLFSMAAGLTLALGGFGLGRVSLIELQHLQRNPFALAQPAAEPEIVADATDRAIAEAPAIAMAPERLQRPSLGESEGREAGFGFAEGGLALKEETRSSIPSDRFRETTRRGREILAERSAPTPARRSEASDASEPEALQPGTSALGVTSPAPAATAPASEADAAADTRARRELAAAIRYRADSSLQEGMDFGGRGLSEPPSLSRFANPLPMQRETYQTSQEEPRRLVENLELAQVPANATALSHQELNKKLHFIHNALKNTTPNANIERLAFSPDGNQLATALDDRTVRLWDANTGQVLNSITVDRGPAPEVFFNTDGALLLRGEGFGAEQYDRITDNPFLNPINDPLSTFAVDVDTASYANVRRFLNQGKLPPKDAVRIEEMINYFDYNYPQPEGNDPFSIQLEVARPPWSDQNRLVQIALQGKAIHPDERPESNLVLLLDVSGSMQAPNRLPLVKDAMRMLVGRLGASDRLAIVIFNHQEHLALPSTPCDRKQEIFDVLDQLQAGGSTNGGAGLETAYEIASNHFIEGGTNRVIICTDGDFNVGLTDQGGLVRLIEEKAKSGVFLSVFGFGMGNLKDNTLEQIANRGNGHYAYIDTYDEARRVLVDQLGGTLVAIAKDVKIQVEFNPAQVASYRLIGYENRLMPAQDFQDDTKDGGEIGAGHSVTALYEVVPNTQAEPPVPALTLKYSKPATVVANSPELLTVSLRSQTPEGDTSTERQRSLIDHGLDYADATPDFRFAAAVAQFGMLLRDSPHKGHATFDAVIELAEASKGHDPAGYRQEFIELVRKAKGIQGQ